VLRAANDGLRFFLELSALAAVAYWGWSEHGGILRWVLVVAGPLAIVLVWGRWVAPKARHPAVDPARLGLEVLVFGSAVTALFDADEPVQAAILGASSRVDLPARPAARRGMLSQSQGLTSLWPRPRPLQRCGGSWLSGKRSRGYRD
jgi:hypothetical protein